MYTSFIFNSFLICIVFVCDRLFQNLFQGRLDQKRNCFDVEYTNARDISTADIQQMHMELANWYFNTSLCLTLKNRYLLVCLFDYKWFVSLLRYDNVFFELVGCSWLLLIEIIG